jgi:hypothetical protein
MNNTFILLGISIFIFFIVIFSILYIILNNYDKRTSPPKNEFIETVKVYDQYKKDPDYNLIYSDYQILGTLSSIKSEPETIILPLYGKRVKSYRWKYFTKVNTGSSQTADGGLRIDIHKKRNNTLESCMKECEMIENGETIKVPAYTNTEFIVQLYDYEPPF